MKLLDIFIVLSSTDATARLSWCRRFALKHAGFEDLHSFAFIGSSGRIGTASDGLFSYVPAGPNKQIDMFLHAYDLRKEGRLAVRALSLQLLTSVSCRACIGCSDACYFETSFDPFWRL